MTVINMLSVKDGGVAVADAQSSSQIRKMNTSEKLHVMGDNKFIYGGTGPTFALDLLSDRSSADIKTEDTLEGAASVVHGKIMSYVTNEKDRSLYAHLGFRLNNYLSGTLDDGRPITPQNLDSARHLLNEVGGNIGLGVLVGGMDGERFRIYGVGSSGSIHRYSTPDASIGSGSDESDKVFTQFVAAIPREKRWQIDAQDGLVKAIEATNASAAINVGVGGSPFIMYMNAKNGKIYTPDENNCTMAADLVRGLTNGFLDKDFVKEKVKHLVTHGRADFRKVNEEMFKQAGMRADALNLALRGFKE